MTVETLTFIYDLLKREVDSLEIAYQQARAALADLDIRDPKRVQFVRSRDDAFYAYDRARDALHDFINKEW